MICSLIGHSVTEIKTRRSPKNGREGDARFGKPLEKTLFENTHAPTLDKLIWCSAQEQCHFNLSNK